MANTIRQIEDKWDNDGITIHPTSNVYSLMLALSTQLDRTLDTADNIKEAHHVATATGKELDKMGNLVQLPRNNGEGDDKYRARLKLQFRSALIGTTYDEFVEFVAVMLETDIDNLDVFTNFDSDPATVYVSADASIYSDSTLTNSEIIDFAGGVIPAGHEVKLQESGTFELKSTGEADDPDKGLTSGSISTGGTLAATLQ